MLDDDAGLPEIEDVNHFDSHVFFRFADGRTVLLTGSDILEAAQRKQHALGDSAEREARRAVQLSHMQSP